MQKFFSLMVVLMLVSSSCQEGGKKETGQSVKTQPNVITPDTFRSLTSVPNAERFLIDTTRSKVVWHCENHKGLVDLKGGQVFVRKDEPVGAYAEAITKTARDTSITYKLMQGTFNNVLQTADFFDGAHYPLLKFKTIDIQHNNGRYLVSGGLSIRHIVQPIQFKMASFRKKEGEISLETEEIPINRTLFGMELNSRSFPEKAKDFIFSDTFFVKVVLFARQK